MNIDDILYEPIVIARKIIYEIWYISNGKYAWPTCRVKSQYINRFEAETVLKELLSNPDLMGKYEIRILS